MMAPQLERAARMRPDYRFAKVNLDEQPQLASAVRVQSLIFSTGFGRARPGSRREHL
jgi:thioredoxin-like negative regulator of GroEL